MITYVLTISETFPKYHIEAGKPTNFVQQTLDGSKIQTIRADYELWAKRFKKINAGLACLSLRVWVGKPYGKGSTQKEIKRFYKEDGIGIEMLSFYKKRLASPIVLGELINKEVHGDSYTTQRYKILTLPEISKNDGLSMPNLESWFKPYKLNKPMAIIHFTNKRYL